jgi:hypothetical protein
MLMGSWQRRKEGATGATNSVPAAPTHKRGIALTRLTSECRLGAECHFTFRFCLLRASVSCAFLLSPLPLTRGQIQQRDGEPLLTAFPQASWMY